MLLFGALSGASAEAVVYPMEVIRRRMQVQAASASSAGQPFKFCLVLLLQGDLFVFCSAALLMHSISCASL